jgi:16S rRNA (guanine527-N7)-methyltransferase
VEQRLEKIFEELNVPRETFLKLQDYVALLLKWNRAINLVSANDIDSIWEKHILISAELIKYIENKNIKIVDLGSGSGIPGIVLSIMGIQHMVLVESCAKKASFLLQASQISNNKVEIINGRIEDQNISCDIITSRALASVDKLIDFTKYVNFHDSMLLIKGSNVMEEIDSLKMRNFSFNVISSLYIQGSNIVQIKKI